MGISDQESRLAAPKIVAMGCFRSKVNPEDMSEAEKNDLCWSVTFVSASSGKELTMLVPHGIPFKGVLFEPATARCAVVLGSGWAEMCAHKLLRIEGFFGADWKSEEVYAGPRVSFQGDCADDAFYLECGASMVEFFVKVGEGQEPNSFDQACISLAKFNESAKDDTLKMMQSGNASQNDIPFGNWDDAFEEDYDADIRGVFRGRFFVRLPPWLTEAAASQPALIAKNAEEAKQALGVKEAQTSMHQLVEASKKQELVDDGTFELIRAYLQEEEEHPLFDLWEGNAKRLLDQAPPLGWRLADATDVNKDKNQILAMYKPHEVHWTYAETKKSNLSFGRVKTGRMVTEKKIVMDERPALMHGGRYFHPDGKVKCQKDTDSDPGQRKFMVIVRDIRDSRTRRFERRKAENFWHDNGAHAEVDALQRVLKNICDGLGSDLAEEREGEIANDAFHKEHGTSPEMEIIYTGLSKKRLDAEERIKNLKCPSHLFNSDGRQELHKGRCRMWYVHMSNQIRADAEL